MKATALSVAAVACLTCTYTAHAIVTYEAEATSTWTLLDSGGMAITFEITPEPTPTATTGTGTASIDADSHTPPVTFFPVAGDSVTIESAVSGSADAPGGTSSAAVFNGVGVRLENTSLFGATAVFEFAYSWFAEVAKTDPLHEFGAASPFFHLTGLAPSGTDMLAIDDGSGGGPVPMAEWLVHPSLLLPPGDAGDTIGGSATVTALVTVPGESINAFSVITDASGRAAVPEPATAALALLGLLGLWSVSGGHASLRRRRVDAPA